MELPVSTRRVAALLVGDDREEPHLQQVRFALLSAGMAWAAEAGVDTAAQALQKGDFRLVLVASDRPVQTTAAVRALRAVPDCPPVLVLASTARVTALVEALAAGAAGYLLVEMPGAGLARAIDCALDGETVVPRGVITVAAEQLRLDADPGVAGVHSPFTLRERQVLLLLREGRSTREIAEELDVSPATVRTHVASVVHKLKVEDRAAAARTGLTGA